MIISEQHSKQPLHKAKLWERILLSLFPQKTYDQVGGCTLQKGNLCACRVVQQAYLFRGISGKYIPILLMTTNSMN